MSRPYAGLAAATALVLGMIAFQQPQAAVWPPLDFSGFDAACRTHAGLQAMVAQQSPGTQPAVERLCGCMAGGFTTLTQPELDVLAKDLLGTSTETERRAVPNYKALSDKAIGELNACMDSEFPRDVAALAPPAAPPEQLEPATTGSTSDADVTAPAPAMAPEPAPVSQPAPEPTPAPVPEPTPAPEPAPAPARPPAAATAALPPPVAPVPAGAPRRLSSEAANFLNTCVGSAPFAGYLMSMKPGDEALQGTICSCLTGTLAPQVAAADLPILARDFLGDKPSGLPRPDNYDAIAGLAQQGLRGCMREAGLAPKF